MDVVSAHEWRPESDRSRWRMGREPHTVQGNLHVFGAQIGRAIDGVGPHPGPRCLDDASTIGIVAVHDGAPL